jgi:acyl dehydratase
VTRSPAAGPPPEPLVFGPLTRTDIVRYQGASGDMNPLHHDETLARAAGLGAPLAVGMLGAGLLAGYAAGWLGPANVRRFKIRFLAPVWPGDTLTCTGVLLKEHQGNAGPLADIELCCVRPTGEAAVRAWATFALEPEPGPGPQPPETVPPETVPRETVPPETVPPETVAWT